MTESPVRVTRQALPPPLPPEERTVGQLVAEAVQLYRRRFWPSLALGAGPALVGVGVAATPGWWQLLVAMTAGSLAAALSYAAACLLAAGERPHSGRFVRAVLLGWLLFLPVPFLYSLLLLPAAAWLGLIGLSVPAAVLERRRTVDAIRRGLRLGRTDLVHAVAGIATLMVVGLLTSFVLFFLLRGTGEATSVVAALLSILVISPVLFLGSALLYFDQAARDRVASPNEEEGDAHVHPALDAQHARRPDVEVEPRSSS